MLLTSLNRKKVDILVTWQNDKSFDVYKVDAIIHENIILMKIEKMLNVFNGTILQQQLAAYEGGTESLRFSGTCHSILPTFQECKTSTLC